MKVDPKLRIGQVLAGKKTNYIISEKLHPAIWRATCPHQPEGSKKTVIVKSAPKSRLKKECVVLKQFRDVRSIRQQLDEIQDPPLMILENLDRNLLDESGSKRLKISDIKDVAKHVLEALAVLHKQNIVHADVKPDNILVNLSSGPNRFSDVKLADMGDCMHVDAVEEGHLVGAPIFRSPEAMLNLRWGTATDIWSLGTTLISLLWGDNWHIFKPAGVDRDDPSYDVRVFINHDTFFGPFPQCFKDSLDAERRAVVELNESYVEERKHFSRTGPPEIAVEDRDFILRVMKLDPRERPGAEELLEHEWFST